MRQNLSLFFLFVLLGSTASSQTPDSLFTADSDSLDSLVDKDSLEDVSVMHTGRFVKADPFKDKLRSRFSFSHEIAPEDIDNSIAESVGELLQMGSWIDVVKVGSWGQPERSLVGGNPRGVNLFIDGHVFGQQDLYFPQTGQLDLNSVALSNISKVEFLPAGIASLWGYGTGILGVDIATKDFGGLEPYSRMTANKGPWGFNRTEAEFGRGLTSRGKFYLTAEFENSDGALENDAYDATSLSGRTTFNLRRRLDVRLSAYQYKSEMKIPLFPDASYKDAERTLSNWMLTGDMFWQKNIHALLSVSWRYDKQNQEVKSGAYGFETRKINEAVGLTVSQTLERQRSLVTIQGRVVRNSLQQLNREDAVYGGQLMFADLFHLRPTVLLLLCSKVAKEEGLDAGISACGGVSYAISKGVDLFSTLGRFVGYPTPMDRFWSPFSAGFKDTVADYTEEGNPSVRPQKSLIADIGADIQRNHYRMGAYFFVSTIDDFIFWSNVDTTMYYGHYKPVNSKARIWGANINAEFDPLDHLSSYVSYSLKQGTDSDKKTQLPHSPKHSFFGYIQFENEFLGREIGFKLRLEANILSERFMDEYERDKEPGVAVLDGKITVRFLDFYFHYAVRNITDQAYRLTGDYSVPQRSFWWGFYWEFFD